MDKLDKHELYQNSVQDVKKETEFFKKTYRLLFNKQAKTFREDFCGTGALSCEWVKNNVQCNAVGIDIDTETLEWGIKNNVEFLNSDSDRVKLINHNVLVEYPEIEKFDVICSLNYSHFLLTKRKDILQYFKNVFRNLSKDSIFIIDFYGGSHIHSDHSHVNYKSSGNSKFISEQVNILNSQQNCSLNFKVSKNKYMPFFKYTFRTYSIIELTELLEEVGFNKFKMYIKEFVEDDEEDEYTEYQEIEEGQDSYFPESDRYNGFIFASVDKSK